MSPEDFESRLKRQPMRRVPRAWRDDVLAAARTAQVAGERREPDSAAGAGLLEQLCAWFWPNPRAWAALATAWGLILVLNLATRDREDDLAVAKVPASSAKEFAPQMIAAWQEQHRLFLEMAGEFNLNEAEATKPETARPRSERRIEWALT